MSTEPKVSVVVPIYGVERYLRQCVDSILAQTLTDIEIILVDDGSPDACPAIVDEYAAKDPRIVAVHQPNGGYGRAVNHGISLAKAPYIGIIESDDWIEPTMYEKLYTRALETGADFVKCMFWAYDSTQPEDKQNVLWNEPERQDWHSAPDGAFKPTEWELIFTLHASLWSNLYRADFLRQIPFIETGSAAYQDFPFIMEVLARANTMSMVKEPLLHYRMEANQGSSTMRKDARLLQMPLMALEARKVLERYGILDQVKEAFFLHAFFANYTFQMNIRKELAQEYFDRTHDVMKPIADYPDFTFKYFTPKERGRARKFVKGGSVSKLRHRWKLRLKKGLLTVRLFGNEYQWKLW